MQSGSPRHEGEPHDICLHCGDGNASKICSACKNNDILCHYCSRECQKANWRVHKPVCGTQAAGIKRTDVAAGQVNAATFSAEAILSGLSVQDGGNPGLHHLVSGKKWWEDLSVERQRERFMMSFQLRNEDAYMYRDEYYGPYNIEKDPFEDFCEYYRMAADKDMLPAACKGKFVNSKYAREMAGYALEKSDVVEKFGYTSGEHMILRMMAEQITGVPTMGVGGMF